MSNQTGRIAFCGLITALSVVVMLLSGVIPVMTLALPAIAGCFLISVVVEIDTKWASMVYAAASILSLLLAGDKEAALFYILFFGYYPILLALLGRIRKPLLCWGAKLVSFNAAVFIEAVISIYVLDIPLEPVAFLGQFTIPVLWILLNIVFVLYDRSMNGLIVMYVRRLHPKIKKMFHL